MFFKSLKRIPGGIKMVQKTFGLILLNRVDMAMVGQESTESMAHLDLILSAVHYLSILSAKNICNLKVSA